MIGESQNFAIQVPSDNLKTSYLWMKKTSLYALCILFFLFSIPAKSQTDSTKSILDKITLGVSTGLNFSDMIYSDPTLAAYETTLLPRAAFGLFADIDLTKHISIRPEVLFIGKGQEIDNLDFYYEFSSNYFEWRLPIKLNFTKPNKVRPYLMIAPAVGFATGGSIYYQSGNEIWATDITDASISPIEVSMLLGAGLTVPFKIGKLALVAGAELSLNVGLTDTYSSKETDGTAYGLNMNYNPIQDTRTNMGISMMASLGIPLRNFKKSPVPPVEPVIIKPVPQHDTIIEPVHEKSCYTVEEINQLIDAGKKVNSKVICMNNLNFDLNKSTLDKNSQAYLKNVITLLGKAPKMKMKISGHTDNTGTDEYNLELSKKRAAAVYNFLISQGISKDRISYEYFGASKPLMDNDSEDHRAQNRRVEFEIIDK